MRKSETPRRREWCRAGRSGGLRRLLDAAEELGDLHRVRVGVVPVGRNRRDRTGCRCRPARPRRPGRDRPPQDQRAGRPDRGRPCRRRRCRHSPRAVRRCGIGRRMTVADRRIRRIGRIGGGCRPPLAGRRGRGGFRRPRRLRPCGRCRTPRTPAGPRRAPSRAWRRSRRPAARRRRRRPPSPRPAPASCTSTGPTPRPGRTPCGRCRGRGSC